MSGSRSRGIGGRPCGGRWPLVACGIFVLAACGSRPLAGEPLAAVPPAKPVDFEADVLPILRRSCLACHNAARGEGDLVLETPARILAGGASGPAVLPGKGEESLLFRLAAHRDEPVMPPDGNDRAAPRLTAAQLGIVRAWIDAGAKGEVRAARPLAWQPPAADRRPVHAVAVSADGLFVAAGRADGIFVHETAGGGTVGPLVDPELPLGGLGRAGASHVSTVDALAFSPDGRRLASGDFRTLRIWKRSEPAPTWRREPVPEGGGAITAATPVNDGRMACGLDDGRVVVLGGGDAPPVALAGHVGRVTALVTVPGGGERLLTAASDGTIRLWDTAAARELGRIDAGGLAVQLAAVAGGTGVAAVGAEGQVRIWPMPAGPPLEPAAPREILPAGSGVTCLAVADTEGGRLACGAADGTVRLHDVAQGRELGRADAGGSVTAVVAMPAAGRIVAGTAAGRVRLFSVKPDGGLDVAAGSPADSAATVDPLDFARQRAAIVVVAAREDLDLAVKVRDAERAASYAAIVEVAKTDVDRVKKEAALAAPAAAVTAAEEAAAKARAAVAAAADAERAKAEAAVKTADDALAKARAAHETALVERRRADEAHAAAKVTVGRVAESVARAVAAAEAAERVLDEAREREKAAGDEFALASRATTAAGERLDRLAAESRGGPRGGPALPAAVTGGIEAAARAVEEADMAAMRSAMQAMTLLQQSEDARKMAEQTAGEADKGVMAARMAAEQADKDVTAAREKLAAAADDEAKTLRGAELEVAERKAATARDDLAAAERRLARVAAARDMATAAAKGAVPEADTLRAGAERRLAEARQRLEAATAEARQAAAAGGRAAAIDEAVAAWKRERAAALLERERRPIVAVAAAPDGGSIVFADDAGGIRRITVGDGRLLGELTAGPAVTVAVTADGGILVAGPRGVGRWPLDPGWMLERRIGGPATSGPFAGAVTALAFSPDGSLLATGGGTPSRSGEIAVWRVDTGEPLVAVADAHSDAVLALDFSPTGDQLASGSADRAVRVFTVATGSLAAGFEGHQQHVLGVTWRADGRLLASAAADGAVKTWDLRRGELRKSHPPIAGEVTGVRYLGAGDTLVAAAADGRIHIRTSDGGNAQSFAGGGTCLHSLGASRMMSVIAAGGEDGSVQLWDGAGKTLAVLRP